MGPERNSVMFLVIVLILFISHFVMIIPSEVKHSNNFRQKGSINHINTGAASEANNTFCHKLFSK